MKSSKKKSLESKGWKFGNAREFLNLSDEEVAYVELKLVLSKNLQEYRREKKLTQEELARRLKSSQFVSSDSASVRTTSRMRENVPCNS